MSQHFKELEKMVSVHLQAENYLAAERVIRSSLEEVGEDDRLSSLLGLVFHQQGQLQEAITQFKKAIQQNPKNEDAVLSLAAIYCDIGEYEVSSTMIANLSGRIGKAKLPMCSELSTRLADAYLHCAKLLQKSGHIEAALDVCKQSLELNPRLLEIFEVLGQIYLKTNRYSEAIHLFESHLDQNPKESLIVSWIGLFKWKNGNKEDARQTWSEHTGKTGEIPTELNMYLLGTRRQLT